MFPGKTRKLLFPALSPSLFGVTVLISNQSTNAFIGIRKLFKQVLASLIKIETFRLTIRRI